MLDLTVDIDFIQFLSPVCSIAWTIATLVVEEAELESHQIVLRVDGCQDGVLFAGLVDMRNLDGVG